MREGSPLEYSFQDWNTTDPLPEFEDGVNGFSLVIPPGDLVISPMSIPDLPVHIPHHPSFGEPSGVVVPLPPVVSHGSIVRPVGGVPDLNSSKEVDLPLTVSSGTRSKRSSTRTTTIPLAMPTSGSKNENISKKAKRKPVNQRWFYDEVPLVNAGVKDKEYFEESEAALVTLVNAGVKDKEHFEESEAEACQPTLVLRGGPSGIESADPLGLFVLGNTDIRSSTSSGGLADLSRTSSSSGSSGLSSSDSNSSVTMTLVARGEGAASNEIDTSSTPTSGHPGDSGPPNPLRPLVTRGSQRSRMTI
jgi:hypothetical protein